VASSRVHGRAAASSWCLRFSQGRAWRWGKASTTARPWWLRARRGRCPPHPPPSARDGARSRGGQWASSSRHAPWPLSPPRRRPPCPGGAHQRPMASSPHSSPWTQQKLGHGAFLSAEESRGSEDDAAVYCAGVGSAWTVGACGTTRTGPLPGGQAPRALPLPDPSPHPGGVVRQPARSSASSRQARPHAAPPPFMVLRRRWLRLRPARGWSTSVERGGGSSSAAVLPPSPPSCSAATTSDPRGWRRRAELPCAAPRARRS